jgi:hypothetical protein
MTCSPCRLTAPTNSPILRQNRAQDDAGAFSGHVPRAQAGVLDRLRRRDDSGRLGWNMPQSRNKTTPARMQATVGCGRSFTEGRRLETLR